MSFGEPSFGGLTKRTAAGKAWEAVFWLLFVADLCAMQYLLAFVLVTPFALMAAGWKALAAWLPLIVLQAAYGGGLVYACVLRYRCPLVMVALLIATPVLVYGAWYLATLARLVPPALSPLLS